MNWLNFPKTGGESLAQEDFLWLANGLKAAIGQGFSIRGVNTYVMNGMRSTLISGTTYGHTAGVAIINGEVCLIDADTTGIDVNVLPYRYVEPVVTYDPAGLIPFETGGPYNLYQITKYVVNGYATSQTGKIRLDTLPYFEDLINDIVFSQGAAVTISSGLLELPAFDNIFQVNIASTDTLNEIVKFDPAMTVVWLHFVGTNPTDYVTINQGAGIITPRGNSYRFRSGDWAMFIVDGATGSYQLINIGDQSTPWEPLTLASSGLTISEPFDDAGKFKTSMNGRVELKGLLNITSYPGGTVDLLNLPADACPFEDYFFYITGLNGSGALVPVTLHIETSGLVTITSAAGLASVSLTGLYFSTI